MSLIWALVLIAIAWALSSVIDAIPHLWQGVAIAPGWLIALVVVAGLAWLVSDP
ncbi:MAG TPA: hypothetical protein V6D02_15500 [Candidatus Obscuribacterales bacterium]